MSRATLSRAKRSRTQALTNTKPSEINIWIPHPGRIKINNDLATYAPAARSWQLSKPARRNAEPALM
jgi:hypothetical protein